ncbi:MAG: alanine racemase [Clostridiales Family XIII bacterium]|jgi:alanine racemase|nr:alanine racemase [Clostridiales Family XIII bacterium]
MDDSYYMRKKRRTAWAEIDLNNIKHNIRQIRKKTGGSEIIGVVKADAYGHGAVKIAETLSGEGVEHLGVATIQEAIVLRNAGVTLPIVILSLTPRGNEKEIIDYKLTPVLSTAPDAIAISEQAVCMGKRVEALVALETGMGRVGFMRSRENVGIIKMISGLPNLKLKGLFSHFATAESADQTYARAQMAEFDSFASELRGAGVPVNYRTMANSAAIFNFPESLYSAVRPGIVLYGYYPDGHIGADDTSLRPAMCVKANIVLLKKAPPGFSVSYGAGFTTERESLIGTLPLGYADGLPRMLTGSGRVIVNGCYAPIIGTICMDQCMIDVTDVPGVEEYDEVIVMGSQGGKSVSPEEIADKSGTIKYEVTCRFGQRLPKLFLYETRQRAGTIDEVDAEGMRKAENGH